MPLPGLAELLALQVPVIAWLKSMTLVPVMTSAPSEPSLGMTSCANDGGAIGRYEQN